MSTELISFEESGNVEENRLGWEITNGLEPLLIQVKNYDMDLCEEKMKYKIFRVMNIKIEGRKKTLFKHFIQFFHSDILLT